MTDAARQLVNLFEGRDRAGLFWPDEIGWRPWWPSVNEVWRHKGRCPARDDGRPGNDPRHWTEAWAVLQQAHDEYEAAKGIGARDTK